MYAKHYENPTMLSKVTAKNVRDVFLRHTVEELPLPSGWTASSAEAVHQLGPVPNPDITKG